MRRWSWLLTAVALAACTGAPRQPPPVAAEPASVPLTAGADGVSAALVRQGYSPGRYHGQWVYCRAEAATGSLLKVRTCVTEAEIRERERRAHEALQAAPLNAQCKPPECAQ